MFAYTPSLLFVDFVWTAFVSAAIAGIVGIIALSAAYTRWFATTITRLDQVVLTIGGLILVFNHLWLNVAGMTIVGATLGLNVLRARRP